MNCNEWEERIALSAGGDLPPGETAAVERHVAECAACQVLLSGLRQSAELLREEHGEALEPAHYAAVRARVLAELARGRRPWWRQAWVYALAAAAAMLLLVAVWPRPRTVQRRVHDAQPVPVAQALMPAANAGGGGGREDPQVPAQRAPGRPRPAASGVTRAGLQGSRLAGREPSWPSVPLISEPEPPAQPLVVKLITDDPNVVIYWITEGKGE